MAYILEAFRKALCAVFIWVIRYGGHDVRTRIGVAMRYIRHGSQSYQLLAVRASRRMRWSLI
jgi:hypothetical protein